MDHKGSTLDSLLVETGELEEVNRRVAEVLEAEAAAYQEGIVAGRNAALERAFDEILAGCAAEGARPCLECKKAANRALRGKF